MSETEYEKGGVMDIGVMLVILSISMIVLKYSGDMLEMAISFTMLTGIYILAKNLSTKKEAV